VKGLLKSSIFAEVDAKRLHRCFILTHGVMLLTCSVMLSPDVNTAKLSRPKCLGEVLLVNEGSEPSQTLTLAV